MTIYMITTRDEYELPVCVADTVRELSKKTGIPYRTITTALYLKIKGYARVEIEEDDDDNE